MNETGEIFWICGECNANNNGAATECSQCGVALQGNQGLNDLFSEKLREGDIDPMSSLVKHLQENARKHQERLRSSKKGNTR